jgi:hypothetical protein
VYELNISESEKPQPPCGRYGQMMGEELAPYECVLGSLDNNNAHASTQNEFRLFLEFRVAASYLLPNAAQPPNFHRLHHDGVRR